MLLVKSVPVGNHSSLTNIPTDQMDSDYLPVLTATSEPGGDTLLSRDAESAPREESATCLPESGLLGTGETG